MTPDQSIEQLGQTSKSLVLLIAEAREAVLTNAQDGEWSARTILAHMRDDEALVMRPRLVRMLVEDDPLLPDFDEKTWAGERSTVRDRKDQLLADFTLQRRASLNVIQRLTPEELERTGRHEVNGPMTIGSLLEHWAAHDVEHIAQLERALGDTLWDVHQRRAHMVEDAQRP